MMQADRTRAAYLGCSEMEELLQAIAQGFFVGSTYGLLALGMGLVYGVSGIVNFSHGDFVTLGMYLCLALFSALWRSIPTFRWSSSCP